MRTKKNRRMSQKARANPLPEGYYWLRVAQEMRVCSKAAPVMYTQLKGAKKGTVFKHGPPTINFSGPIPIPPAWTPVADFGNDLEAAFTFISNSMLFGDT